MGMLALSRLMSPKRRRRTLAGCCTSDSDESAANEARRKGSPCRLRGNFGGANSKRGRSSHLTLDRRSSHLTLDSLPGDVMHQILALLPMQDAARSACVSRGLLRSWRYYPELEFSAKTLSLDEQHTCVHGQMATDVIRRIDGAMQIRAGRWVKRLKFELGFFRRLRACYINHWLDAATTFRIEDLTLELPRDDSMKYRFPCNLFFGEKECSIQSLCLYACAFSPEHGSSSFRSLKRVHFSFVHITTEESCFFLSNAPTLERMELEYCHEIACLRIPCTLQLLNFLRVERCNMLQTVESDAPNLSTFHYEGPIIQFSLGGSLQLKVVNISIYPWFNLFAYAVKELPILAPNLETLFLMSADEVGGFYTLSIVPGEKFLHLKYLEFAIVGPRRQVGHHIQYYSLASLLNASPALETFILHVEQSGQQIAHLVLDPSKLEELPRHCHKSIKYVTITGFSAIKKLVELIYYILENAVSLQCLTLDHRIRGFENSLVARIAQDTGTRDYQEWRNNFGDHEEDLRHCRRQQYRYSLAYVSHVFIGKYILERVPPSVELKILGALPDEIISSLSAKERQRIILPTIYE